ncbi:MAG: hypothetical protein ACKOWO_05320 [Sediminibacterium sp.]
MKQIRTTYKLIFSTFVCAIIFTSCQKENPELVTNQNLKNSSSLYTIQNNRMVLTSVEDFDSLINISDVDMINSIRNLDYVSYDEGLSSTDSNTISDSFLSVVLNSDQVIQIKNYIYKVNKSSNKVFALHKNNFSSYEDLVNENTTNNKILEFSTEDDVFDLLSERETNEKVLSNNCVNTDYDNDGGWLKYADFIDEDNIYGKGTKNRCVFKYRCMVKYDNWGIYRKLFTEFRHKQTQGGSFDETDFTFVYDMKYKSKNGETGVDNETPIFPFALNLNVQVSPSYYDYSADFKEIPHYKGTRCLINYDLRAWVWMRNRQTLKPILAPESGCIRIHDGGVCFFPCSYENC